MHSGWVNALCMSPTLCDSACECAIICVWRWQHTECAASLQPQHQFPVYYIQSFILQASTEGLLVSAPRWNVHTCSEPLKHMNPISPFSRGGGGGLSGMWTWQKPNPAGCALVSSETVRDLLNGTVPPRGEARERRGEETRLSPQRENIWKDFRNGPCLYIASVHYILHMHKFFNT